MINKFHFHHKKYSLLCNKLYTSVKQCEISFWANLHWIYTSKATVDYFLNSAGRPRSMAESHFKRQLKTKKIEPSIQSLLTCQKWAGYRPSKARAQALGSGLEKS